MMFIDPNFSEYLKVLQKELYSSPLTFIPEKRSKYDPDYYKKNREKLIANTKRWYQRRKERLAKE